MRAGDISLEHLNAYEARVQLERHVEQPKDKIKLG